MPAFDHHLMPLHPPLEGDSYLQLQSSGPINFQTKSGHTIFVRFLVLDEQVRVIAVTIPEIAAGHQDQPKWMKQIMEGAMSAIRLGGDPEAVPLHTANGFVNLMYKSDEPEPLYQAAIRFTRNLEYRLNINSILGIFVEINNKAVASAAALLAEGQVPTIPPHYRVLSLIRAIELLYQKEPDRDAALNQFEQHFAELKISDHPFRNALHQLRTRCAHGRSRGRRNPEPFVGIGYNEPDLFRLLNLLQSVVAHGLQVMHGMEFLGIEHKLETDSGLLSPPRE